MDLLVYFIKFFNAFFMFLSCCFFFSGLNRRKGKQGFMYSIWVGCPVVMSVATRMKGIFLGRGSDCLAQAGCEPSYNLGEKVTLHCGRAMYSPVN